MSAPHVHPFTPQQHLVLRAALGDRDDALESWTELLAGATEVPALDQGSFRLLPLVYRNLGESGREFEAATILRGIYRQAWYRNQVAAASAARALGHLVAAGIDPMLLKGWAAVELAYGEPGRRPMNDADILVRPRDFDRACTILEDKGFHALSGVGRSHRGRRTFHAVAFQDANGIDVDLHHHMLEEGNWAGADAGLWDRSAPATFGEVPVRVPSAEDLLLNVCVHGVRWDPVPAIRWVADAVTLMRAHPIDWQLVAAESGRRGIALAMEAALREVARFEPIPEAIFTQLGGTRRGPLERLDFRAQQSGDSTRAQVTRYITRFLRLTSGRDPLHRAAAFPVFLQGMWELDSAREVPREGVHRVAARLRRRTPIRGRQRAN